LKNTNTPVVVFGLDAGVPELLQLWSEEGHLPTLRSIIDRGSSGKISGDESISPHGLWLSLFSGISRSKHGYYYFRQLEPGSYNVKPYVNLNALPFWYSLKDKKLLIVDAPEVLAIRGLNGYQIANWSVHNAPESATSEPADFLQMFGPQMRIPEKFNCSDRENHRIYNRLVERIQKKGAILCNVLKQNQFDFIVIVFSESHIAGHQFWKDQASLLKIYQEIDHQIGKMLSCIPQDSNAFIVSPMGIMDQNPTRGLTQAFCFELGYQHRQKNPRGSLKPISIARKIVPESLRSVISNSLPQNLRQRLLGNIFGNNIIWDKTTAFALPSNYTGLIRVNLEEREPNGIVKPGNEYTQLLDQIENDLKQLVDPITGQPAVERTIRTIDIYQTDPPEVLPDLFIKWRPTSYFVDRVVHPKTELKQRRPKFYRSNNHSEVGFFACAGPTITENFRRQEISVLDIAPALQSAVQNIELVRTKIS
jgi:predicted AlkP superfamily phosphohydrolase/phosphomutase